MADRSTFFPTPRAFTGNMRDMSRHAKHFSFTIVICFGIAIIIWAGTGEAFLESLTFSLSIGLSIHTLTILGIAVSHAPALWMIWLITVPVGVLSGLVIGGTLNGIPVQQILSSHSPIMSLVIALIASYVLYSYFSISEMREQLHIEELNRVQSEKKLVETRLRLLQSQIEPHFLFNTLSHVVSLMHVDQDRAELMLRKLAQFLRASLRRSRSEHAMLQDELDLIADYLAILKVRMADRLSYRFEVELPPEAISLPPLILQPLVENAVVHGLEPLAEGGTLTVSVKEKDGMLLLTVSDDGGGLGTGKTVPGVGIANVKERIGLLFGDDATLEIEDGVPTGLVARVSIPIEAVIQ